METALESMMFYYTFSLINSVRSMHRLLYDSTAATRTLKLPTTLSSISCGIYLISVFTNSVFQVPRQTIVRRAEILGIGWPGVMGLTQNESVPWEVMSEVLKCSVREIRRDLISRTKHLNIFVFL